MVFADVGSYTKCEKGIAPLSGVVWSQREKGLNAAAAAGLPNARPAKQKHRLQWLRFWQLQWGIKMGTMQARGHVPAIEFQNKAEHTQSNHVFAYQSSKQTVRRLKAKEKRVRKMDRILGPPVVLSTSVGPKNGTPFSEKANNL